MKRKSIVIILLLLLLIGGGIFAYHYFQEKKERNAIVVFGNVDVRQVDLSFRVSGRVDKMFFEEGDLVKPGTLVGLLDKEPYEDQVRQAAANVESIKASFANADLILNRRLELIKDGSVSQEDLEDTRSNRDVLAANLKQAQAALSVALTNLKFTETYCPTEGTILTRIREPGWVVNPADPIYTLSIIAPVWIRAFITEPDLGIVYPGMVAEIHTDTPGGPVYKGQVGFISPVAEFTPKSVETTSLRTDLVYRIRVYAENPDKGLRQGMPVTVHLPLRN